MAKEGLISLIDKPKVITAGVWRWLSRMANALYVIQRRGKSMESPMVGTINRAPGSLLYFSGYQLASLCGEF